MSRLRRPKDLTFGWPSFWGARLPNDTFFEESQASAAFVRSCEIMHVHCVNEKSEFQALHYTQSGLLLL